PAIECAAGTRCVPVHQGPIPRSFPRRLPRLPPWVAARVRTIGDGPGPKRDVTIDPFRAPDRRGIGPTAQRNTAMESRADAFGPIDRPGHASPTAVAPEAIVDPTAILTSQQGAGSSEDCAHGNPGPDLATFAGGATR